MFVDRVIAHMGEMTNRRLAGLVQKTIMYSTSLMSDMMDDPMTHAMGVPVGDFSYKWRRDERRVLKALLSELKRRNIYLFAQKLIEEHLQYH